MALLGFIASVAISAAALGGAGGDRSQIPKPSQPIRVVSATHEVRFPDDVVFRLEAEADSPITDIRLFYQLARRNISVYGYPQFAPATQVSADFVVRTSGASYIPSGVDIEYYYVIQDDLGNSFETERYLLGYRDPRYEWQELRVENFTILWHDRPEKQVAQVAADVDHRLGAVRALFGLQEAPPMKAVIFNDRREARLSFPVISGTATSRHVFGEFAFGEFDLFVLGGLERDGMVHEMTHLLLDEAVDSPLARVPSWLNEGLAMYFESSSPGREVGIARAVRDHRSMPLRAMGSVPGRPADVSLFYAQARSVVKHMMDVHGAERMAALLGAINRGSRIDEAVPQVYGMTLEELEQEWQTTLTRETPTVQVVDPGTFGTSVIIAGAVATAAVLSGLGWLARRRRRLEQDSGTD